MTIAVAHIFTTAAVAAQFDQQASEQASTGRTYGPLHALLKTAYGLDVPASTAAAVKYLNFQLFGAEKVPALATGDGAKAAVVVVTQVLHAYATALRAGLTNPDKLAATPAVAPLPAWADPVAIAKKKDERKAKNAAKANDEAAAAIADAAKVAAADAILTAAGATVVTDEAGEVSVSVAAESAAGLPSLEVLQAAVAAAVPVDHAAQFQAAWNVIAPMLAQGVITTDQRDACIKALEMAVCAAPTIDPATVSAARKRAAKADKKVSAPLPKEVAALV